MFLPLSGAKAVTPAAPAQTEEAEETLAPVTLDGQTLFLLRGNSALPADVRAKGVSERIHTVAADTRIAADSLNAVDMGAYTVLAAGDRVLVRLVDADAAFDQISRPLQAELYLKRIGEAIRTYRLARAPAALLRNVAVAAGATLATLGLLLLLRFLIRKLEDLADQRFATHLDTLQHHSHQIIQAKSLRGFIHAALRGVRLLLGLIVTFAWLHLTLSTFPWTRPVALQLFPIFLSPLQQMGNALVRAIPDLIFLAILILIARYSLKLIRLYFTGLERGTITVQNFDPDWAVPTYNIVRLLVISFAAVIAYPYIPGSSSEAFKGVSLFLGVVFSLGSSSVISNLIAGYSLTYRRAFKTGDRIRLGEVYGDVVNSGLVVTRVRTPKNEDVVVPNSLILNSNVTNYSTMARQKALILHTTVGIGYGYPWRLVEAMLLQAADRTPGLLKEPGPFVRQLELGEFSIKYQINVYCDEAQKTLQLYSLLHQNILDVFNENGVQIMTPAYEGDPETPKVVPKEKLFVPLAGKTNGKSHKEK